MSDNIRDTITTRLLAGDEPATIAADLGLEVGAINDTPAVILPGYVADDGNAEVGYPGADSADEAAQEYVDDGDWGDWGDWGDRSSTIWIGVRTWKTGLYLVRDEDEPDDRTLWDVIEGEIDDSRERHTVTLEAEEPDCADGHEHDWRSPYSVLGGVKENPGVRGHGGGVICTEVCAHCGRYRVTDTWARNPETGEQGLRSVEYRDADEDSLAWLWRRLASAAEDIELPAGYTIRRDNDEQSFRLVRDADEEAVKCADDELRDAVERKTWDHIIEQFSSAADGAL